MQENLYLSIESSGNYAKRVNNLLFLNLSSTCKTIRLTSRSTCQTFDLPLCSLTTPIPSFTPLPPHLNHQLTIPHLSPQLTTPPPPPLNHKPLHLKEDLYVKYQLEECKMIRPQAKGV